MSAEIKSKPFGYNGKILLIDLSESLVQVIKPDQGFYRTYFGGGLLGTYYAFKEMSSGVDPLEPENILVFSPSILTGAPVTGVSRFTVTAKSPLTGGIGDTQCGGGWGPKLKHAGFDALVFRGRSQKPVYLWIDRGQVEIRDASHLWGMVTGDCEDAIRKELGDEKIEIAQIGPAGENLIKFSCITGGLSHFAGRTGMGAVMGSKNLKAIAVRGKRSYDYHNEEKVKITAKKGAEAFKNSELHQNFRKFGTAMGMSWFKKLGMIVTRNFQSSQFEMTDEITGEKLADTILKNNDTCWSCVVRCKRVVEAAAPFPIEARYGGPEYETISMMGSNLGIGDLALICKLNEMCNKYTLDTISTGGMIAFAMECFENKIISEKETGGLELKFGNGDAALKLVEMIALRQGVGDILADGYPAAIGKWGDNCRRFAIASKNQPFPAHMPRVKPSQALMYAVNPFGADHMSSEHDWLSGTDSDLARGLGLANFGEVGELDSAKIQGTMLSQFYYSLMDTLNLCDFCWGPGALYSFRDIEQLIEDVTGWKVTFWELMRAGERRVNLMKFFNFREGFDRRHDRLPHRIFEPLPDGPNEGRKISSDQFELALSQYYEMMNWDPQNACPTKGKLQELGLGWVLDFIEKG